MIKNIQMNSDIANAWSDYLSWNAVYNSNPTLTNLGYLNSAVTQYRHILDVHQPTKKEILYATAPDV